jgi:hypothetical protein
MGDGPNAVLLAQLLHAVHDESDALIANDPVRLVDATSRKQHLLRLLAPQTHALRAIRRLDVDERERLAREAARLTAVDGHTIERLGAHRPSEIDQPFAAARAAHWN